MNRIQRLLCRLRRHRGQHQVMIERHAQMFLQHGCLLVEVATGKARCCGCGRVHVGQFKRLAGVAINLRDAS